MGFILYRIVLGVALLGLVATHKISDAPPKKEIPKPTTASVGLVRRA